MGLGQHAVLGREVVDDRPFADLELAGDVSEVRSVVAVFGDVTHEALEDQVAATVEAATGLGFHADHDNRDLNRLYSQTY